MIADQDDPRRREDEEEDDEELDRQALLQQMETKPEPGYSLDGDGKQPPTVKEETTPTTPSTTPSVFQSPNTSVRGYIDAAINSFAPTVQGLTGEAARKQATQDYLTSLVPEIQKRGGVVGDIKNEKMQINGQWVDVLRDIEGAAAPQYLVEEPGGGTPSMLGAMGMGGGNAGFGMLSSLPTDQSTYQELMRRLQEILGAEAVDRGALISQMKR